MEDITSDIFEGCLTQTLCISERKRGKNQIKLTSENIEIVLKQTPISVNQIYSTFGKRH